MLKIKNIQKSYGDFKALNNVSFTVKTGDITGFLGPNGAGKTTTMRIITGFLTPEKGEILFENKSLQPNYKNIITNTGYLPENNPLYSNLRVDEFLTFIAQMKNVYVEEEIADICKKCGIENVLEKEIETLSKGYKQRVGLAKALLGNPDYLILDEPTEGLDPNQKEEILNLIKSFSKDKTILFSSHNLSEVSQIADRIIVINKGEIVAKGQKDKLIRKYFKNAKISVKTDAPQKSFKSKIKKLSNIEDIKTVDKKTKFSEYEISCNKPDECSLKIFNLIIRNKWQLTELHTKSQGLEDLFREITKK